MLDGLYDALTPDIEHFGSHEASCVSKPSLKPASAWSSHCAAAIILAGNQIHGRLMNRACVVLGDKPELLYPQAQQELRQLGYQTTLQYLQVILACVIL